MVANPEYFFEDFWKHLVSLKNIHGGKNGCHKLINIKTNKTEITFQCDCQTIIIYPPRKDRDNSYMTVNISKRDYDDRKRGRDTE